MKINYNILKVSEFFKFKMDYVKYFYYNFIQIFKKIMFVFYNLWRERL